MAVSSFGTRFGWGFYGKPKGNHPWLGGPRKKGHPKVKFDPLERMCRSALGEPWVNLLPFRPEGKVNSMSGQVKSLGTPWSAWLQEKHTECSARFVLTALSAHLPKALRKQQEHSETKSRSRVAGATMETATATTAHPICG